MFAPPRVWVPLPVLSSDPGPLLLSAMIPENVLVPVELIVKAGRSRR